MVSDILEAAARVLARHGAHRFTTTRVAATAGVSVGSLYQYFPNKEAILFRLQVDEWRETSTLMRDLLADRSVPPFERLRAVVRAFFRSECAEASLRVALGDAAPLFRDVPEMQSQRSLGMRQILLFMREAIPAATRRDRTLAAEIVTMAMGEVGRRISEEGRTAARVDALATAMGDMFCAYLEPFAARPAARHRAARPPRGSPGC